jgi:hypothetical protein
MPTHFAVAEIVHQDEHDVGFLTVSCLRVLRKDDNSYQRG